MKKKLPRVNRNNLRQTLWDALVALENGTLTERQLSHLILRIAEYQDKLKK